MITEQLVTQAIEAKPLQASGRGAFSRNRKPSHKGNML